MLFLVAASVTRARVSNKGTTAEPADSAGTAHIALTTGPTSIAAAITAVIFRSSGETVRVKRTRTQASKRYTNSSDDVSPITARAADAPHMRRDPPHDDDGAKARAVIHYADH